ncbi:hypothetical protein JCM5350_007586 [Sporobolomyces pararoseus]
MSQADPVAQDCAVCDNKTTQVCSGCKTLYFCSSKCQKLIWYTHKHLCKKGFDPSNFSIPPLSGNEIETLGKKKDQPVTHNNEAVQAHFLKGLAGDGSVQEPYLSACLVLARHHLYQVSTANFQAVVARALESGRKRDAWGVLSLSLVEFIICRPARDHFASPASNPFRRIARLFHQMLIRPTVIDHYLSAPKGSSSHYVPVVKIAINRCMKIGETMVNNSEEAAESLNESIKAAVEREMQDSRSRSGSLDQIDRFRSMVSNVTLSPVLEALQQDFI